MSTVTGTSTTQTQFDLLHRTNNVAPTDDKTVGGGNAGAAGGPLPQIDAQTMSDLRASLASLGLTTSPRQVDVLIVEVAISLRDIESNSQSKKITVDQSAARERLASQGKQIEDMIKKQDEAKEKKESASIADKIKLAFEWLGAVIAVVVAVVAIATGAGAVVGALLLAAAVTAIALAADSSVKEATGHGIGYHSAKSMGLSDEQAAKHEQAFQITMAVLGAVLSIAAGGVSAVNSVRAAASTGASAATAATKTVGESIKEGLKAVWNFAGREGMSKGAKMATKGIEIAEAVNTIGSTATSITATSYQGVATKLSAEAKEYEGKSKIDAAALNQLNDMIDQAFARLMAAGDRFNAIIDDRMEAINDRAQLTGKARFAG